MPRSIFVIALIGLLLGAHVCGKQVAAYAQTTSFDVSSWDDSFKPPRHTGLESLQSRGGGPLYAIATQSSIPGLESERSTVGKWTEDGWENIGGSFTGFLDALAVGPDGAVYVLGDIVKLDGRPTSEGGTRPQLVLKYDGERWAEIRRVSGATLIAVSESGLVCIGGGANNRYGASGIGVQCRRGSSWYRLQGGADAVFDLEFGRGETLFASVSDGGFEQYFAVWDGGRWSSEAASVGHLLYTSDDRLFGIGRFDDIGRRVGERTDGGWSPLPPMPSGDVRYITADPSDGTLYAGASEADYGFETVYRFDSGEWHLVPSPIDGTLRSFVHDGRHLFVSGTASLEHDPSTNGFVWWNGEAWDGMKGGLGISSHVFDIEQRRDGNLIVAGERGWFGEHLGLVAEWSYGQWTPLAAGLDGFRVHDIEIGGDGSVYAAGYISGIEADQSSHRISGVATWNGSRWSSIGEGLSGDSPVGHSQAEVVKISPQGVLHAGGRFTHSGDRPLSGIARWDGGTWQSVGGGVEKIKATDGVYDIAFGPDGVMYVAGQFASAGGVPASNIAAWDGSEWQSLGSGIRGKRVTEIEVSGSRLYAGGIFTVAGGVPVRNVAFWDGDRWHAMDEGPNAGVESMTTAPDGSILIGGTFNWAGNKRVNGVARWIDDAWRPVYEAPRPSGRIDDILVANDASLYFGGSFVSAGGIASSKIAHFTPDHPWEEPSSTELSAAWPNPADDVATATVYLENDGDVAADLFDALGRKVATVARREAQAGYQELQIATSSLPSGVYFLRIVAGGETSTRKIVVTH